jgi:hypothetical protein
MHPNLGRRKPANHPHLMERSALYRRALAPIMLFAGVLGVIAAALGFSFILDSTREFRCPLAWQRGHFCNRAHFSSRRQALKDNESFWSPPTRRVAQALLPPLSAGMCVSLVVVYIMNGMLVHRIQPATDLVWLLFYGCALHAAGFFMPRGMKWFGWILLALLALSFYSWHCPTED